MNGRLDEPNLCTNSADFTWRTRTGNVMACCTVLHKLTVSTMIVYILDVYYIKNISNFMYLTGIISTVHLVKIGKGTTETVKMLRVIYGENGRR